MTHKLFKWLLVLAMGVAGCGPIAGDSGSGWGVRAWFDAPLPATVFFPPNPCQIVAHGSSPIGIAVFELSINGEITSIPSPETDSSLVTLTRDCGLSRPGEYLLLLRSQDNDGNWSGFAETNLTIVGGEIPIATLPTTEPTATETAMPTLTSTVEPAGVISIERVSTNLVYLGRTNCGPLDVTITSRVTSPKGIQVVMLFYRFQIGNTSTEFQILSMNSIGGDLYELTLNPTSLLGGSVPFDQAILQYQIIVQQNDGDTSLRTSVMSDIAVKACV